MSIATLSGAVAIPRRDAPDEGQSWITLAEASRILGVHPTTVQRAALAGRIRHRSQLVRTVYFAEDVRSMAS